MMLPAQAALIDRLTRALAPGAVVTDPDLIAPWLTDWRGRFHGAAAAIIAPAGAQEARQTIVAAGEAGVPLVPQGGNTSMVGGATPPADGSALILSSRRMNRIREIGGAHVVAEAGVILQHLHEAVAERNLRFPLTLGARGSATIGGLVSTNAGGTQVLRHGTMRALVMGVEAVLPDGTLIERLSPLRKDTRGYDLAQLFTGAEGTLGFVTAATLRLVPAIAARAVAWVGLDSPAAALALLRDLEGALPGMVESFEIVPADSLAAVLAHLSDTRPPLAGEHAWHVLIEAVGDAPEAPLAEALAAAIEASRAGDAVIAKSEAEAEALWRLRDSLSAAERALGPAVQHDIAVPVDTMPRFMVEAAAAAEARFPGTHATAFGHLGDGNVHFHVRAAPGMETDRFYAEQAPVITAFVHDLVVAAGGTISAEHGIGQMKRDEFARLTPPGELAALHAVKQALDPAGLMNPGKLLALAPNTPSN